MAAAAGRAPRLPGLDWLRAAGALAVVWIHACDPSPLALRWSCWTGFAVPGFTLASFYLLQRRAGGKPAPTMGRLLTARLRRIVPAYLAWSAVYVAVRLLKQAATGQSTLSIDPIGWVFMGGASYQLYFLPALVYWTVLFLPLVYAAGRTRRPRATATALLALAAALYATARLTHAPLANAGIPFIWRQMVDLAWLVPAGCACAVAWPGGPPWRTRGARAAWAFGGLAAFGLAACNRLPSMWVPLATALGPFAAALCVARPAPVPVGRVAAVSFGIYLAHGVFVEGLQLVLGRLGLPLAAAPVTLAVVALAFLGSCVLCLLLARIPRLRWLVG